MSAPDRQRHAAKAGARLGAGVNLVTEGGSVLMKHQMKH